jgi:hypothetical protein
MRVRAETLRAGDLVLDKGNWTRIRSLTVAERIVMLSFANGRAATVPRDEMVGVVRQRAAA